MNAHRLELREVQGYYERAGENAARIVYFQGMALGAFTLGIPLILAALLALYVAVKSNLLELGNIADPGIYLFATVSFLAGFSERRARVLLGNVAGGVGTGEAKK